MGGSKKLSWASDVNLCQVRLFLSEDSPSQVGLGNQDHLQAKALWHVQSGGGGLSNDSDNLPPGFEGVQLENLWKAKLSQIPLAKWKCPPRFEVNSDWLVVAGEESRETEAQSQRELRVLEAVYPRPSAIPPNPSELVGGEESGRDGRSTPVVPLTPIEDEDAAAPVDTPMVAQPEPLPVGVFSSGGGSATASVQGVVEPDVLEAAQAALSSIMSSNSDQGSLIDRDLLIKILSDPKMVEQLVANHGAPAQSVSSASMHNLPSSSSFRGTQHVPASGVQNMVSAGFPPRPAVGVQSVTTSSTPNIPSTTQYAIPSIRSPTPQSSFDSVNNAISRRDPLSAHVTRPDFVPPSRPTISNGPFYPPSSVGPNPRPSMGAPVAKDVNYYKSLIQQHGGERRETLPQIGHQSSQQLGSIQEPLNVTKSRESKPKIMKPCIYFNSPRGCRNGANCTFQHDISSQQRVSGISDVHNAKRVKLDREITDT